MSTVPLPSQPRGVDAAIAQLRAWIRRYVSIDALATIAIWLIGAFWITGLLDYLPAWLGLRESPRAARAILLAVAAGGAAYLLVRRLVMPLLVRWSDRSVALLIERRLPSLGGSLITWIENRDLERQRQQGELSRGWQSSADPRLRGQVAREVEARLAGVDVFEVMRWGPLRVKCGVLGGLLAASALAAAAAPQWTGLWSRRLLLLSEEPWPRRTMLEAGGLQIVVPNFTGQTERLTYRVPFENGEASVPRGQDAKLLAAADLASELVPSFCTVTYRTAGGESGRANLRRLPIDREAKVQPFALEGPPLEAVREDLRLTISGGDVQLPTLDLRVAEAVELLEVSLAVRYPAYLRARPDSTYLDGTLPFRNGLRLPEGTEVVLRARANVPLQKFDYRIAGQTEAQAVREGTAAAAGELLELPLGPLAEGVLVELRPWDAAGHCSVDVKQFAIAAAEDQVPSADLRLAGIGGAVTPLARVPLRAAVRDDHGVRSSQAQLFVKEDLAYERSLPEPRGGEIEDELDLRQLRNGGQLALEPGQEITLAVAVDDYYDLGGGERRASSNPIQLAVVTEGELLVLLDRRELELRNRLEQILIELNQLAELMGRGAAESLQGIAAPVDSPEPTPDASPGAADVGDAQADPSDPAAAGPRDPLVAARVQESKIQAEKNQAELQGIASQVAAINAELQNNRVDSVDRQRRLEKQVHAPIIAVLESDFAELVRRLQEAENGLRDGGFEPSQMRQAIAADLQVIAKLNEVLAAMLDVQDFNEILEMARGLLEGQEKAIEATKELQKQKALELFK